MRKDTYFANRDENKAHLALSIKAYRAAFEIDLPHFNTFPAINLAALNLFNEEREQAHQWATKTLNQLQKTKAKQTNYWDLATEIEALLILGKADNLPTLLDQAKQANLGQFAQLASTAKQLRRLCSHMNSSDELLQTLSPPAVIHFTGHIVSNTGRFRPEHLQAVKQQIDQTLDQTPYMAAYGWLRVPTFFLQKVVWKEKST